MDLLNQFMDLCRISSVSGNESALREYLLTNFGTHFTETIVDTVGNVIFQKGTRGKPIALVTHLDTVPHSQPIVPILENGRIRNANHGILGADDKAGIAASLWAALHDPTDRRVELVMTVGEESDFRGSLGLDPALLEARSGYIIDTAQPVGTVVTAAPSLFHWTLRLTSAGGHAGLRSDNPITQQLSRLSDLFAHMSTLQTGRFNVGSIQGGTAPNVIASTLMFQGEFRGFGDAEEADFLQLIESLSSPDCTSELEQVATSYQVDSAELVEFHMACQVAKIPYREQTVFGLSDANILRPKGVPLVVIGTGAQHTHSQDESITVEQLTNLGQLLQAILAGGNQ